MSRSLLLSAGRGPVEVRRFVALLGQHLAATLGLPLPKGDEAPASLRIPLPEGVDGAAFVGEHCLYAPLRGRQQRSRWFVSVALVTPPAPIAIDRQAVRLSAARAGGPGGQNVNKRSTAVRAVDPTTGLSVRATGQRSQKANRAAALDRLDAQAAALQADQERAAAQSQQGVHNCVRGRTPRFSYRLDAQGRLRPEADQPESRTTSQ